MSADPWIQTRYGHAVDLLDPKPEQIHPGDIAWALARINRYTGHALWPYSVAEHCVLVADWLLIHHGREAAVGGLLHDAAEAYLGDVASPLKRCLGPEYARLTERFDAAIAERFSVPVEWLHLPEVREADLRILLTEKAQLFPAPDPRPWGLDHIEPLDVGTLPCWTPKVAQRSWLNWLRRQAGVSDAA